MDIGIRQAGFEVLACVEVDPHCCQTLQNAIKREGLKTILFEKDIRQIDPSQLKADLGFQAGELDLLFGGSPCQRGASHFRENGAKGGEWKGSPRDDSP